jgi:hypothetical protein
MRLSPKEETVIALVVIALFVALPLLSLRFGVDSRPVGKPLGWIGAPRERR